MAIRAIAGNVIREAIRQKIVYVTLLFTFLMFGIEPMLPSFNVGVRIQLFLDIALGVAYVAIAVLAVALSVNQVPGEIEKRTIYNVLSKPVQRSDYLLGKYIGIVVILVSCAALIGLAVFVFTFGYFGVVKAGLFQGILTATLEAALISAFALLISTFTSPAVNVFACILFYFIGHVKNDALTILIKAGGSAKVMAYPFKYLLPSLENFNVNEAVARDLVLRPAFIAEQVLYALVFSALFLSIASVTLGRKEL